MPSDNLQRKAFSGVIWGFMEKFSMQIVTFVVGIILARLLSPSDYGLIAMATIFVAISQTLVDSGFSAALIRKQDRTDLDYSTVFDINVVMSAVMCLLLFASAGYIADFYHEPLLVKIIDLNGLYIFLGSVISVQETKLQAEMQFKTRSIINTLNSIVSGVASLVMAFSGFGVWSLIYPKFLVIISAALLYWHYQHWVPGVRFSKQSARSMFSFGSKLLLSQLLNTIYDNLYPMIIGKKFSASDLGFFSKGQAFATLPSTTITGVLGGVAYPVLSSIQEDNERLMRAYRKMLRLSAYIVFPLMIGIAALARPLVIALITIKWEPSIIYLQILCFCMMLYPIHALNLNLLQVKGRSDLFLRLEIIKKILGVFILILSLPFGLVWMCFGLLIHSFLCLFLNTYYTGKLINIGYLVQMRDLMPSVLLSLSMGVIVYLLALPDYSIYLQLIVGFVVGAGYYYVVSKMIHSKDLEYLVDIVNENIVKRLKK